MKRIAIVEDNPDNHLLLETLLEGRYLLKHYADSTEAVNGILADPPDLVLMDISMPIMDGVEAQYLIRSKAGFSDLPIIAISAHAMTGDREKFLELGFNYYVSKPILDEQDIIQPIEACLRLSTFKPDR